MEEQERQQHVLSKRKKGKEQRQKLKVCQLLSGIDGKGSRWSKREAGRVDEGAEEDEAAEAAAEEEVEASRVMRKICQAAWAKVEIEGDQKQ